MNGEIKRFFAGAVEGQWRMNWKSWRFLIAQSTGWRVIDNDSGKADTDVLNADEACIAFTICTIGPS